MKYRALVLLLSPLVTVFAIPLKSPRASSLADPRTSPTRADNLPKPVHCQFVRIPFIDVPAGQSASVAEMKISGKEAF